MTTGTYPAFTPAKVDDLSPGDWAFARSRAGPSHYTLIMMTDKPCQDEDDPPCWVLCIDGGTARFVCSTKFGDSVAKLQGDVRASVPISCEELTSLGNYKPGLLYASLSGEGLHLVAQLEINSGPFVVELSGTNMMDRIPAGADLQQISRVDYRAPDESDWSVLAQIDKPLQP